MKCRALRDLGHLVGLMVALTVVLGALPTFTVHGAVTNGSALLSSPFGATDSVPGVRFVHLATAANRFSNYTLIDHPLTNNNPNAILFVTENSTPGGLVGTPNERLIGVFYSEAFDQWAIFNQDREGLTVGAAFNVLIPDVHAGVFVHVAMESSASTYIDHPLTNNNADAILFVTPNWNPGGGVSGHYNDHPIGVRYDHDSVKWAIFNQDGDGMEEGAAFNVLIAPVRAAAFVHRATATNTDGHATVINHPLTNNNPNAILFITQNRNPGGEGGAYNNDSVAVYYSLVEGKWGIYNQGRNIIHESASFNVVVPTTDTAFFVHEATTENTVLYTTSVNHPLTNDHPNALLFATQNWNPGGGGTGINNDHALGVRYSGLKWAIFNQDGANVTVGTAFNALIPNVDTGVFVHESTLANTYGTSTYIDHPLTNNRTNVLLFVTPNFSPGGVETGVHNAHPIGVRFDGGEEKWAVYNEDGISMPMATAYNILVPSPSSAVFVHRATDENTFLYWTDIDHPLANGNPNALLMVTQNYNPGGMVGGDNPHEIGVYYRPNPGRWAIFNQDSAPMLQGAAFNVLVGPRRVYLPLVMRSP